MHALGTAVLLQYDSRLRFRIVKGRARTGDRRIVVRIDRYLLISAGYPVARGTHLVDFGLADYSVGIVERLVAFRIGNGYRLDFMYILAYILDLAVFPVNHGSVAVVPRRSINHGAVGGDATRHRPYREILALEVLLGHGKHPGLAVLPNYRTVLTDALSLLLFADCITYPFGTVARNAHHVAPVRTTLRNTGEHVVAVEVENDRTTVLMVGDKKLAVIGNGKRLTTFEKRGRERTEFDFFSGLRVDNHRIVFPRIVLHRFVRKTADVLAAGRHYAAVLEHPFLPETVDGEVGCQLIDRNRLGCLPGRHRHGSLSLGIAIIVFY